MPNLTEASGGDPPPEAGDGDEGEQGPWVTVATFWQPMDAHLARIRVESFDIDCVLLDEFLVATDWLYANAVGGIKLQVPAARADEAREALQRPGLPQAAEDADASTSSDPIAPPANRLPAMKCPACGSLKSHPLRWSRWSVFMTILLLGFPLPFLSRRWECDDCGTQWKPDGGSGPAD
jgi:hypothetical protein